VFVYYQVIAYLRCLHTKQVFVYDQVFVYYVFLMFAGPLCAVNLFLVVMSEQVHPQPSILNPRP
jgi:Ni,Fe-hydrogenase I cytochrome b subunit